MVLNIKEIMVD